MSDFFTDLWTSVFTPGATPTLLVATNASFAALQLLLLALLAATRSVHFVILSVLCGGLWWSINWFANEVGALKEEEEQQQRPKGGRGGKDGATSSGDGGNSGGGASRGGVGGVDGGPAFESEDTETEEPASAIASSSFAKQPRGLRQRAAVGEAAGLRPAVDDGDLSTSTSGLSVHSIDSRHRSSTGNVSGTDSEWDKLDSEAE